MQQNKVFQSKKESFFDKLTGKKVGILLVASLLISVLATIIGMATGVKGVDWSVYYRFVLMTLQRLPLLLLLTVSISFALCRLQGVESFQEIRDTDEAWITITLGSSIIASVLIMWVLLS